LRRDKIASSAVADEITKRTTSFAKTIVDLVKEENSLDRAAAAREPFNRAAEGRENPAERIADEREKTAPAEGKKFDHAPHPALNLRPQGPARRAMDRKIDYEKLRDINNAAKRRAAAAKSRSLSRDFDRER
jgi:hypothetical protein